MKYFLLTFLVSCSIFQSEIKQPFENYKVKENPLHKNEDFVDHLSNLANDYIQSPGIELVKLNKTSRKYFHRRYNDIVANNELLLNNKNVKPKFYIVKEKSPFYFSLPGGHFFFSLGLIKKYMQNEQLFIAVLAYEMIKVHRNIFKRNVIVPVGYLRTERILSLTRLDLIEKNEVSKWAYFAMKRSGYDPSAYLIWLQTQNRNVLEFVLQRGDSRSISREEFMFKNFIAEQGVGTERFSNGYVKSSKRFYKMLNYMEKVKL